MIIVPVKDGENIERALKKFKRKFEKTGVVKELRARQQYDKPFCFEASQDGTRHLRTAVARKRGIISKKSSKNLVV